VSVPLKPDQQRNQKTSFATFAKNYSEEITEPFLKIKLLAVFKDWHLQREPMSLELRITDRAGKEKTIERQTNTLLIWSFYGFCWQKEKYRITIWSFKIVVSTQNRCFALTFVLLSLLSKDQHIILISEHRLTSTYVQTLCLSVITHTSLFIYCCLFVIPVNSGVWSWEWCVCLCVCVCVWMCSKPKSNDNFFFFCHCRQTGFSLKVGRNMLRLMKCVWCSSTVHTLSM